MENEEIDITDYELDDMELRGDDDGQSDNDSLLGASVEDLEKLLNENDLTIGANEERIKNMEKEKFQLLIAEVLEQSKTLNAQEERLIYLEDKTGVRSEGRLKQKYDLDLYLDELATIDATLDAAIMGPDYYTIEEQEEMKNRKKEIKRKIDIVELRRDKENLGIYAEEEFRIYLEGLSAEEIQEIILHNSKEISENLKEISIMESILKPRLIERIRGQQKTLAEQQRQIAELEAKGNDK